MKVFRVPLQLARESRSAAKRELQNYIYPHRLLYYADFEELPASFGAWKNDGFELSSGVLNFRAARDLRRPHHRIVTFSDTVPDSLAEQLELGVINELDWNEETSCEVQVSHSRRHLFGFGRRPSDLEFADLRQALIPVFRPFAKEGSAIFRSSRLLNGEVLELVANTPIGNREWGRELFIAVQEYSRSTLPVVSYQGVKWDSYVQGSVNGR